MKKLLISTTILVASICTNALSRSQHMRKTKPVLIKTVDSKVNKHQKRDDNARELVELLMNKQQMIETLNSLIDTGFQQSGMQVPEKLRNKIVDHLISYFNSDEVTDEFVRIYKESFKSDEIDEIRNFFKTKVGKKYLQKMPELSSKGFKIGMEASTKVMKDFGPELQNYAPSAHEETERSVKCDSTGCYVQETSEQHPRHQKHKHHGHSHTNAQ